MNIGKSLKRDNVDVDPAILLRGIKDVLGGCHVALRNRDSMAPARLRYNCSERRIHFRSIHYL